MVKRRFSAQESTTKRQLRNLINKIEATSLKIEMDEFTGEVKVVFDRNGKRYTKTCNRWDNSLDNLRAIGLSIDYLYRAVEVYGVETKEEFNDLFNTIFVGIEATPDDNVLLIGSSSEWWEILGINKNSSRKDVVNAFRSLAKVHHPDNGGDPEQFRRLRSAYDKAISETK